MKSRIELLRNALRDKVEEYLLKQAILELENGKGSFKSGKSTGGDNEAAREVAFEKIAAKFK